MTRYLLCAFLVFALAIVLAGCGGGQGASTSTTATAQGATFITAQDAPLPSVLAFTITLNSITLNNASGSVSVLSAPTTVDFARLLGLRTLLAFSSVPTGSYTSATVSLASPVITYLDLSKTPPVSTLSGTLTTSTVTLSFPQALVVSAGGLAGLHMEFDLRSSLQLDLAGQITGVVNPHIDFKPVAPTDDDAKITDLRGGLVSVNVAANSFVIQRVGGRQLTIVVNSSTKFNGSNSLSTLVAPAVIEVDGIMQANGSVLATSVEVVIVEQAFIGGRILSVTPSSGPAQSITILVGEELPDLSGIQVGMPLVLDVSQVQNYSIRNLDNWFTNFVFNSSTLNPGQRIAVGGAISGTTIVPSRVVLRRQGVVGDLVLGNVQIVSGNQGSFQIQNNGLLGYVLGAPLDVSTSNATLFPNVNGLAGIQTGGSMKLATYGLVLKDATTGNPRMYAHWVRVLP